LIFFLLSFSFSVLIFFLLSFPLFSFYFYFMIASARETTSAYTSSARVVGT